MPKNLIMDGFKFNLWTPQREIADFQPIVKEHAKEIFGEDSLYFDIPQELRSNAGIGSKPDGFVIVFSKTPKFYVVEVELAEHGVHDHIVTQISRFNTALKKPETKSKIIRMLYENIRHNNEKLTFAKAKINDELFKFLTDLLEEAPNVVIVIDEAIGELGEAVDELPLMAEIVEFQTFRRSDAPDIHTHLFEPLSISDIEEPEETDVESPIQNEYRKNWEARLRWVVPSVQSITSELSQKILDLPNVKTAIHGRNLLFYKGKPTVKSVFVAYILTQKNLGVCIRTEPSIFKDPHNVTGDKEYSGWFFKQNREKRFKVTDRSQIPYAMELIKQSYDLAEFGK